MKRRAILTLLLLVVARGAARADSHPDALGQIPVIKAATNDEVQKRALAYLTERQAAPEVNTAAAAIWAGDTSAATALDRLVATIALVEPRAKALLELCAHQREARALAAQDWLTADDTPAWVRNNLRLYYGRWLSQQRLYDESLEQLAGLEPTDVVDPAALLFYQSVAHHRLLNKTDGLRTIDRLLSQVVEGPSRYVTVAGLMREDLKGLEDDSLDHIARRMDDIRRRLDLGRAGEKVRKEEDGVIASLDKLIEEMEKQQQQQQQKNAGGGTAPPSQPMPDSRIAAAKGPGEVDRKKLGNTAGWGDLPAKEREEALQQIGKDFPSHYRDVIEQYFKKLATEKEPSGK
ncbi:MAG TPA: hypothetical protein VHD36_06440 [Pirellulales bacterium]|nr:hypothetical protein [Pirellulales bacterium]